MAILTWGDADGTWMVRSALPAPGNRFQGWTPDTVDDMESAVALGGVQTHTFVFGTRPVVRMALIGVARWGSAYTSAGVARTERMLDAVDRLRLRLARGLAVNVLPQGTDVTLVHVCVQAPDGGRAEFAVDNPETGESTLRLALVRQDGTAMAFPY